MIVNIEIIDHPFISNILKIIINENISILSLVEIETQDFPQRSLNSTA